ncbi:MAG: hypothetical protein QM755_04330 [Luteolibacter sp.]
MKPNRLLALVSAAMFLSCAAPTRTPQTVRSLEAVDTSKFTRDQTLAIAKAKEDFQRVKTGGRPLYAKAESFLNDGGTVYYQGPGYELISWHKMDTHRGRDVYRIGPQIVLRPEITGGQPIECEEISYIPRP